MQRLAWEVYRLKLPTLKPVFPPAGVPSVQAAAGASYSLVRQRLVKLLTLPLVLSELCGHALGGRVQG